MYSGGWYRNGLVLVLGFVSLCQSVCKLSCDAQWPEGINISQVLLHVPVITKRPHKKTWTGRSLLPAETLTCRAPYHGLTRSTLNQSPIYYILMPITYCLHSNIRSELDWAGVWIQKLGGQWAINLGSITLLHKQTPKILYSFWKGMRGIKGKLTVICARGNNFHFFR